MSDSWSGDYPESQWDDAQLVEAAGLQSQTGTHAARVVAYRAQAELIRRLTQELRELRSASEKSSTRLERLTWVLVVLTISLVGLTVVLLAQS